MYQDPCVDEQRQPSPPTPHVKGGSRCPQAQRGAGGSAKEARVRGPRVGGRQRSDEKPWVSEGEIGILSSGRMKDLKHDIHKTSCEAHGYC